MPATSSKPASNGQGQVVQPEISLAIRTIEGPQCAECGEPTGIVTINGHSLQVEAKGVMGRCGVIVLTLHLCRLKRPADPPRRKPR